MFLDENNCSVVVTGIMLVIAYLSSCTWGVATTV